MDLKIFVIHATGLNDRAARMRQQLDGLGLDYTFVTEGDKESLTDEIIAENFAKCSVIYQKTGQVVLSSISWPIAI